MKFQNPDVVSLREEGVTDEKQLELYSLIVGACLRPHMYVCKDSFLLLSAFLDGYVWGLHTPKYFGDPSVFDDFTYCLRKRFNVHEALAWSQVISLQYPIEKEALEQFPILFREFLISQLAE